MARSAVDTYGRPYALVSEVVEGSVVIVDHDFDCMRPWSEKVVKIDDMKLKNWGYDGSLYIDCDEGQHFLHVHYDNASGVEFYVGIYMKGTI